MLTKIKSIVTSDIWHNFRDVRFLGLIVFGLIVILTSWSGVQVIETNYQLQQDIAALDKKNQLRKLENENLKLTNAYYQTETFLELVARQQFNKGQPGEKLILVPKEIAQAKAPKLESSQQSQESSQSLTKYQQNLNDWIDFLLRRNTSI